MNIYGLDFTSAPRPKKPITCARCKLARGVLSLEQIDSLASFVEFEDFLRTPSPWVVGMDFPFRQPRQLIENLRWPSTWEGMVQHISKMSKEEFIRELEAYSQGREKGDKHHLRRTDRLARARSPMMLYRVPVGRMFFEGAPRLLAAGVSILPCYLREDPRLVLEAYPALVVRRWVGNQSYKTDTRKQQTAGMRSARAEIVRHLRSGEAKTQFGFNVQLSDQEADIVIQDGSGDRLDALLCAVQAGWAYSQRDQNYGIPADCDPLEGWIADPQMLGK